jgi:hypothetical protein
VSEFELYIAIEFFSGVAHIRFVLGIIIFGIVLLFVLQKTKNISKDTFKLLISVISILCFVIAVLNLGLFVWKTKSMMSCNELGGRLIGIPSVPVRTTSPFYCELSTKDGGKQCSDSSECEGYCVPSIQDRTKKQVGTCNEWGSKPEPCLSHLKNGIVVQGAGCNF